MQRNKKMIGVLVGLAIAVSACGSSSDSADTEEVTADSEATMTTDADADNAINMFNGKPLDGRNLTVNEARPMEPRAPRAPRGEGRGNW